MNFLLSFVTIRLPYIACFRPYFNTDFLLYFLSFFATRLPRLFCFYNLTKRSSYSLLHAVPLKQWFLTIIFEFFDAKPILQCLWLFSFSPFSSTCTFTVLELFSYCHQLLSYVFSNENSIMQYVCRGSTLKLSFMLLYLHSQDKDPFCWWWVVLGSARLFLLLGSARLFLWFASAGLPLLGFSLYLPPLGYFSVFASSGRFVMLSVGWQYLQSCSLVVCVLAGYAGYHGYALPEA